MKTRIRETQYKNGSITYMPQIKVGIWRWEDLSVYEYGDKEFVEKQMKEKLQEMVILPKIQRESAKNLWEIIEKTGAKLVISSSWRHRWSHLKKMLQSSENEQGDNLWNHVTSKTPSMTGGGRGNEILQYLSDYHKTCKEGHHITHWIAIDDSDAGMSRIKDLNCYVETRSHVGLDEDSARLAISLLNT